ncbi:MAG: glycosyltransferase family 4 protein [Terracidiphilus sp.]
MPSELALPKAPIVVVSLLGLVGETGVQKHVCNLLDFTRHIQEDCTFISPDECSDHRLPRRVFFAVARRVQRVWNSDHLRRFLYFVNARAIRRELKKRLRNQDAWCVYAQDPFTARQILSLRKNKLQRVVLVVHFNQSQAHEWVQRGWTVADSPVFRRIYEQETATLEQVDGLVFPSRFMQAEIEKRCVPARDRIVISNCCIAEPAAGSARLADIISIGTLEPRKNQQFLLRVLSEAKRLGHEYTLSLVGGGADREALEKLADELRVARQVNFVGRIDNAAALISSHRVLAHSALIENMPVTLLEALAAGVPILAPQVGGIPEVFDDGVEGYLWPLDSPAIAAAKLIAILDDASTLERMSRAARRRYELHFQPDQIQPDLLKFIRGNLKPEAQIQEIAPARPLLRA